MKAELQDVVCVYMGTHKDCKDHKELIHIALSEKEAKDFIDDQARNWMRDERFDECKIELYGNGLEIRHMCGDNLYDRNVSFTFNSKCAKLLIDV